MKPHRQSFWLPGSLSLFCLVTISPLRAQIVHDATLPNPSIITPNGNTSVITGGTQAGRNLFHSFREFSVRTGSEASFQQIDQGIENVISRVTGSSISSIDGLITVLQADGTVSKANFFLLNPNGMAFGPNARLDIRGSFVGSTASAVNFVDGKHFSATGPQTTPLLTSSLPVGLQYGSNPGKILVQGDGQGIRETSDLIDGTVGLRLRQPNQTLALVGGDVVLERGTLKTAGGRIELGSVAAPGLVSLTPAEKGWALGYSGVLTFGDIYLSQQAAVDASGAGGGDIQIWGRRVAITDGSVIEASTLREKPGGTLNVTAKEAVELIGRSADGYPSGLYTQVYSEATGAGGNVTLETGQLILRDGSEISVSTYGEGAGGNVSLETRQLILQERSQILANTYGEGTGGTLEVSASESVELVGDALLADGEVYLSGLFTQTGENATGNGGNLSISTGKLIVRDGAQVNSTTSGVGRAGNLTIQATDVELVGDAISADGKLLTYRGVPYPSGLFAGTDIGSGGDGGTLTVETERLHLRDGAVVQTSTLGAGDAGRLIVQASESVELIGKSADGRLPTALYALSGGTPGFPGFDEATGRGGDLEIKTGELIVQDGAAVAVGSFSRTSDALGAGDLQITAQTIRLDNLGKLTAETNSGQGGNITLDVQDLLLLRRNSNISSTAGIASAGGNGGNITIDTPFIVAVPSENSDITANAFEGAGGLIQITAQQVFGLERREQLTQLSDITAFSEQNPELNGVVEINTPDVDPSRGLVNLPAEVVDASGLIASSCGAPQRQGQSKFIVTGRGGLPSNPSDTLSSDIVWSDLRPQTRQAQNLTSSEQATQQTLPTTGQLVEAQGWVINNKGEVVLTAQAPTVTPPSYWQTPASCSGS